MLATGGPTGSPSMVGSVTALRGIVSIMDAANAGPSGHGNPPGAAGLAGINEGSTGSTVSIVRSFIPGIPGRPCNYTVGMTSLSDPNGHFLFVLFHLITSWIINSPTIGQPQGPSQTIEIVGGSNPGAPAFPTLQGTFTTATGAVTAQGSGTVAGRSNVLVEFVGTLSANGNLNGTLTVGRAAAGFTSLPGGAIVYNVAGFKSP